MTTSRTAEAAKADWTERIGRRSGDASVGTTPTLPAPTGLCATAGRGLVQLDWDTVEGAAGYLVHRSASADGPFEPVDHRGLDVLAVPHPPYADTTGCPGQPVWYAVAAVPDAATVGELSAPVAATPLTAASGAARVDVRVDAGRVRGDLHRPWRPMIGSEHLSHLLSADRSGGRPIGAELEAALRMVHREVGVESVRAHGILCDDLGVYRERDGEPAYDFTGVDRVYDLVLEMGLRPVVELSFMPHDLAADPTETVFGYDAIISPPRDWDRWGDLVRALVDHLVGRYGLAEVRDRWSFEVWNEANLEVFWSGTPEEFFRLYDVSARAVRDVHPDLVVGGPSSAAGGWVEELLAHTARSGAAVDFVSTHAYGSPPLDLRPLLARHGREDAAILWTEWGVTPKHFSPVNDSVFAATFLLRGMRSAMGRLDALSYWVVSDHFEELGRPPRLLHGGFGLLSVGNLRKPRYWALSLLARLGDEELPTTLAGDGAGGLVEVVAARHSDGRVGVLMWNGTLDQTKADGEYLLDRTVRVRVDRLSAAAYSTNHLRVDEQHANLRQAWRDIGGDADWPDESQWSALREADRLPELEEQRSVLPAHGSVTFEVDLPMPGISFVELTPVP